MFTPPALQQLLTENITYSELCGTYHQLVRSFVDNGDGVVFVPRLSSARFGVPRFSIQVFALRGVVDQWPVAVSTTPLDEQCLRRLFSRFVAYLASTILPDFYKTTVAQLWACLTVSTGAAGLHSELEAVALEYQTAGFVSLGFAQLSKPLDVSDDQFLGVMAMFVNGSLRGAPSMLYQSELTEYFLGSTLIAYLSTMPHGDPPWSHYARALVCLLRSYPPSDCPQLLRFCERYCSLGIPASFPPARVPPDSVVRALWNSTDGRLQQSVQDFFLEYPLDPSVSVHLRPWLWNHCTAALAALAAAFPQPSLTFNDSRWCDWYTEMGALVPDTFSS